MSTAETTPRPGELKMAILGVVTGYFARHGHTPETRELMLEALAEVASVDLCLIANDEDREMALGIHCDDIVRFTEQRVLDGRRARRKRRALS